MEWLKELVHKVIARCGRDELVSLGLVNCGAGEGTTNSRSIGVTQVSPREHIAHPHNATGSFYSEDDGCISCGAPNASAPDLMDWHEESCGKHHYAHCIFRRQPETPGEVERAILAMSVSCVENLRYRGADLVILKRIRELGMGHLCDRLEQIVISGD